MGFTTIWMTPLNQNPYEPYGEQLSPVRTKFSGYHGYWPISSTKVDFRILHTNIAHLSLGYIRSTFYHHKKFYKTYSLRARPTDYQISLPPGFFS